MASTSKYGGASYTEAELADPSPPAIIIRRAELGYVDRPLETSKEEESSSDQDGGDSIPSGEKLPTENAKPTARDRKPARTTVSRSKATARTSGADSMDGNGRETETDSPEDDFSDFE